MSALDLTRNYADGIVLLEADLDAIQTDLTTFFNTTKVNDDNIQNGGIAGSTKLVAASISTAKLTDGTVTSSKIATSAITTAKIADGAVTTAKIADSAVTTAKIATGSIVAADFADGAVTGAKHAAANTVIATNAISFTTSGTSSEVVTNASVTITASGKPIWVGIQGTSTAAGHLQVKSNTSQLNQLVKIYRDATLIYSFDAMLYQPNDQSTIYIPANLIWTIDLSPGTGSITYTMQLDSGTAGDLAILGSPKMYAFEMV